jgi:F-type H+-transporting ATPase subunit epsilon
MTMSLQVLIPTGVMLETEILSLSASDASGQFGLLPNHQDFCTALVPCLVMYRDAEGDERHLAVDGGVLLLEGNHLSIVTREAFAVPDIEAGAELATAQLAERQRQEREATITFKQLVASLLEQMPVLERRR